MYRQTTIDSKELEELQQQVRNAEVKDQQALLTEFLSNIKQMIQEKATLHLPQDLPNRNAIIQPQVFLSYAWEAQGTTKLENLHTLLKHLRDDLQTAGLVPWLDLERLTGHIAKQMGQNIKISQYVLLIGTNRYTERTKEGQDTNVRKELEFALQEAKENKRIDFLLPLMLEGDFTSTFIASVAENLIRDCRTWYDLEQKPGQWQSFDSYLKELTQYEPLGILPTLLGFSGVNNELKSYYDECKKDYRKHQKALMATLKLRQREAEIKKLINKLFIVDKNYKILRISVLIVGIGIACKFLISRNFDNSNPSSSTDKPTSIKKDKKSIASSPEKFSVQNDICQQDDYHSYSNSSLDKFNLPYDNNINNQCLISHNPPIQNETSLQNDDNLNNSISGKSNLPPDDDSNAQHSSLTNSQSNLNSSPYDDGISISMLQPLNLKRSDICYPGDELSSTVSNASATAPRLKSNTVSVALKQNDLHELLLEKNNKPTENKITQTELTQETIKLPTIVEEPTLKNLAIIRKSDYIEFFRVENLSTEDTMMKKSYQKMQATIRAFYETEYQGIPLFMPQEDKMSHLDINDYIQTKFKRQDDNPSEENKMDRPLLLITAESGYGKTVWCHHTLYFWSVGLYWNQCYQLIIYIPASKIITKIKKIQPDEKIDLSSLISTIYQFDEEIKTYINKILVNKDKEILYIFDGLDEIIEKMYSAKAHTLPLLHEILNKKNVLVTSRIYGVAYLSKELKNIRSPKKIYHYQLNPLKNELQMRKYMDILFKNDVDKQKQLEIYIQAGLNRAFDTIITNPLGLQLFSGAWIKLLSWKGNKDKPRNPTHDKLLSEYVNAVTLRFLSKRGEDSLILAADKIKAMKFTIDLVKLITGFLQANTKSEIATDDLQRLINTYRDIFSQNDPKSYKNYLKLVYGHSSYEIENYEILLDLIDLNFITSTQIGEIQNNKALPYHFQYPIIEIFFQRWYLADCIFSNLNLNKLAITDFCQTKLFDDIHDRIINSHIHFFDEKYKDYQSTMKTIFSIYLHRDDVGIENIINKYFKKNNEYALESHNLGIAIAAVNEIIGENIHKENILNFITAVKNKGNAELLSLIQSPSKIRIDQLENNIVVNTLKTNLYFYKVLITEIDFLNLLRPSTPIIKVINLLEIVKHINYFDTDLNNAAWKLVIHENLEIISAAVEFLTKFKQYDKISPQNLLTQLINPKHDNQRETITARVDAIKQLLLQYNYVNANLVTTLFELLNHQTSNEHLIIKLLLNLVTNNEMQLTNRQCGHLPTINEQGSPDHDETLVCYTLNDQTLPPKSVQTTDSIVSNNTGCVDGFIVKLFLQHPESHLVDRYKTLPFIFIYPQEQKFYYIRHDNPLDNFVEYEIYEPSAIRKLKEIKQDSDLVTLINQFKNEHFNTCYSAITYFECLLLQANRLEAIQVLLQAGFLEKLGPTDHQFLFLLNQFFVNKTTTSAQKNHLLEAIHGRELSNRKITLLFTQSANESSQEVKTLIESLILIAQKDSDPIVRINAVKILGNAIHTKGHTLNSPIDITYLNNYQAESLINQIPSGVIQTNKYILNSLIDITYWNNPQVVGFIIDQIPSDLNDVLYSPFYWIIINSNDHYILDVIFTAISSRYMLSNMMDYLESQSTLNSFTQKLVNLLAEIFYKKHFINLLMMLQKVSSKNKIDNHQVLINILKHDAIQEEIMNRIIDHSNSRVYLPHQSYCERLKYFKPWLYIYAKDDLQKISNLLRCIMYLHDTNLVVTHRVLTTTSFVQKFALSPFIHDADVRQMKSVLKTYGSNYKSKNYNDLEIIIKGINFTINNQCNMNGFENFFELFTSFYASVMLTSIPKSEKHAILKNIFQDNFLTSCFSKEAYIYLLLLTLKDPQVDNYNHFLQLKQTCYPTDVDFNRELKAISRVITQPEIRNSLQSLADYYDRSWYNPFAYWPTSSFLADIHRVFNSLHEDLIDHLIIYQKNLQTSSASQTANLDYFGLRQSSTYISAAVGFISSQSMDLVKTILGEYRIYDYNLASHQVSANGLLDQNPYAVAMPLSRHQHQKISLFEIDIKQQSTTISFAEHTSSTVVTSCILGMLTQGLNTLVLANTGEPRIANLVIDCTHIMMLIISLDKDIHLFSVLCPLLINQIMLRTTKRLQLSPMLAKSIVMLTNLCLVLQHKSSLQAVLSLGISLMGYAFGTSLIPKVTPAMIPYQSQPLSDLVYQGKVQSLDKQWQKLKISIEDIDKGKYITQRKPLKRIKSLHRTGTMMLNKLRAQGQATLVQVINIRKLGWELEAELAALTPINHYHSVRLFNQKSQSLGKVLSNTMHRLGF